MNAIVLAGGIPEENDQLYAYTQGGAKALVDIAGKPMVQWVVDALDRAPSVGDLIVVGLPPGSSLNCSKPLSLLEDQGSMLRNIKAGVDRLAVSHPTDTHALIVSSDIPSITPEIVEWRIDVARAADVDLDYAVVERSTMEARFPRSNRSYVRLRDVEVCGGDINVARLALAQDEDLWTRLIEARKNALRQAALFGFGTLFLVMARRLTLPDAERRVSAQLGLKGRVSRSPYAEVAMDVDKPHQLELLRDELGRRSAQNL
jgi:GTP:adenosylcobinamide-phosphate guanylyltransferase